MSTSYIPSLSLFYSLLFFTTFIPFRFLYGFTWSYMAYLHSISYLSFSFPFVPYLYSFVPLCDLFVPFLLSLVPFFRLFVPFYLFVTCSLFSPFLSFTYPLFLPFFSICSFPFSYLLPFSFFLKRSPFLPLLLTFTQK